MGVNRVGVYRVGVDEVEVTRVARALSACLMSPRYLVMVSKYSNGE